MEDGNSSCALDKKPSFFTWMQNEHMNISFIPLTQVLVSLFSWLLKDREKKKEKKKEREKNKIKGKGRNKGEEKRRQEREAMRREKSRIMEPNQL